MRSSRADVAIRDVRRAPTGFNPRYAARYREYRYTVWNGPRSPLRERTALGVRVPLDTAAMARAGSVFIGRHDFSAFGAADRSPVRTVHAVRVRRDGPARDDRRPGRRLPPRDGPADGGRPPGGRPRTRWMRQRSGRHSPVRDRPSTGQPPRRRACASGASPSGGGPGTNERRTRGTMNAKTYTVRESEIERRWFVVDATDETLGRLASRIARVLEGKHKPTYQPNLDSRRPRDRAQRRRGSPSPATSSRASSTSATAAIPQGFKEETLGHLLERRPGGGHPPRRQGDAAAQPARRPAAAQAEGLRRLRPSASGPAA